MLNIHKDIKPFFSWLKSDSLISTQAQTSGINQSTLPQTHYRYKIVTRKYFFKYNMTIIAFNRLSRKSASIFFFPN